MVRKIILMAGLLGLPMIFPSTAQAEEYCREYTKTVSVGGRAEQAYGTACYRPDGSWEIVNLEGSNYGRDKVRDVMYDDIKRQTSNRHYRDRDRVIVVENYNRRAAPRYYRPHNRYQAVSYGTWPFVFNFGNNSHYKQKSNYKKNNKNYRKAYNNNHRR